MANDLVTRLLLNSSNFDNNLRKSTAEVRKMQQQQMELKKSVDTAISGLTKMAGVVGIGFTALEGFNKTIAATQTLTDAMGETLEGAKSATNEFFFA